MARVRSTGEFFGFFERAGSSIGSPRPIPDPKTSVPIPERIDWALHRIASSQRYSSSLYEIETLWSIDDVHDANVVLDLYEAADKKAAKELERNSGKK